MEDSGHWNLLSGQESYTAAPCGAPNRDAEWTARQLDGYTEAPHNGAPSQGNLARIVRPLLEIVMTGITMLWLPIVLSAVVVFIMSSILHMVLPWHHGDYATLPNQDAVMNVLRPFAIPPADYMVPHPANREELRTPEFAEKMKTGPVMVLTVIPSGPFSMGRNLAMWFIYIVVVSIFAAYVGGRALGPGAPYLSVFRFVGVTAFVGYTLALWQMLIWYHRSTTTTLKSTVDGLIYALLTAGVFGWLWPR